MKRQREKLYNSTQEQRDLSRAASNAASSAGVQKVLPFHCCSLSLTPFREPVCNKHGVIFDKENLVSFVTEHNKDPVTGETMTVDDIITLNMDLTEDSGIAWQCPILSKEFKDHTKIIAIRHGNKANVYSYEAYKELNLKAKNMEDLISGERFTKSDVIILNDPENQELKRIRDINSFYHIRHARELKSETNTNIRQNLTATRALEKMRKNMNEGSSLLKARTIEDETTDSKPKYLVSDVTGVAYNTNQGAASSFTSTGVNLKTQSTQRYATEEEILQAQFRVMRQRRRKGYANIHTTHGVIAVELHCDIAPRTTTNFLGLARTGQYDGTVFHRLIPQFCIQGGKSKDKSYWGGPFADEFDDRLKHEEFILSMANSGPNTNKEQFFISFKSCPHLDRKHSVFGKVIDGFEVLKDIESVPTNKEDAPIEDIKILKICILQDPALEAREMEDERLSKLGSKTKGGESKKKNTEEDVDRSRDRVGKYLKPRQEQVSIWDSGSERAWHEMTKESAPKKTKFGDFDGW